MDYLPKKPGRTVGQTHGQSKSMVNGHPTSGTHHTMQSQPAPLVDAIPSAQTSMRGGQPQMRQFAPDRIDKSLGYQQSSSRASPIPKLDAQRSKIAVTGGGQNNASSPPQPDTATSMSILGRVWLMLLIVLMIPMQVGQSVMKHLTLLYQRSYLICIYHSTNIGLIYGLVFSLYMIRNMIYDYGYMFELLLIICFGTGLLNVKNLILHVAILIWIVISIYATKLLIVIEILIMIALHLNTIHMVMIKMIMPDAPQAMIDKFMLVDTHTRIETISNLIGLTTKQLTWIDQFFVFQFDLVLSLRKLPGFKLPWLSLLLLFLNNSCRIFDGIEFNERIKMMNPSSLVQKMTNHELDLRSDAWRQIRNLS